MEKEHAKQKAVPICPLCGNGERRVLYEDLQDRWLGFPGKWDLKLCKGCGLAYLDPCPREEDIGRAYSNYFTHQAPIDASGIGGNGLSKFWPVLLSKKVYRWVLGPIGRKRAEQYDMYHSHRTPGRLLDVGCGNGLFLKRMRDLGWTVQGVETDPQSAKVARETFGLAVHTGSLQSAGFPDDHFDSVTMSHVIEHVYDPTLVLAECRRILRPGGRLVIVTPNIESMGHRYFGRAWLSLDPPRHLRVFSRTSIDLLIQQAGFPQSETHTSAAQADMIFTDTLRIKDSGRLDAPLKRGWHLYSQIFLLLELLVIPFMPNIGEELVVKVRK